MRPEYGLAARDALGVGAHVEADIDRARDLLGVAAFLGAPVVEHGVLGLPRRGVDIRGVPAVGILGRGADGALLPLPADPDGQALLERLGIAPRVVELEVVALEVGDGLVEERAENLHRLLEMILADPDALEGNAEALVLVLVPARPDPEIAAAVGEMIDGAHGLGEHPGVAVVDADDERPYPHVLGVEGDGGHGADRLEAIAVAVSIGRLLEVVGGGEPVEALGVGEAPEPAHLVHGTAHVAQVHTERHGHGKVSGESCRVVMVRPPSTTRVWPVTQRASSLAR